MFRKNSASKQQSFFDLQHQLPRHTLARLQHSWAHSFRHEIFDRIDEEKARGLYSVIESRPNVPINILVGAEILKAGWGWTDKEMMSALEFDLQTRYALGLDDLSQEVYTSRTVYNFRRRVRDYQTETGINLFAAIFHDITEVHLDKFSVQVGWQRMDSTQLLSNLAQLNRLELCLSTLQKGVKALPPEVQAEWQKAHPQYLDKKPQNISYHLKKEEVATHLPLVGQLLLDLHTTLQQHEADVTVLALVKRLLTEQFHLEEAAPISLKATTELTGGQLQSPHDPEATYRYKHDQGHVGYVANLSETCDPDNKVQLVTSVQVAANNTDDGVLLAEAVADWQARGLEVTRITTDGGYNGEVAAAACGECIQLCPTTVRGGNSASDKFGWEAYETTFSPEGKPEQITCPNGQTVSLQQSKKAHWHFAEFAPEQCATCPFFKKQCRVEPRVKKPPVLRVTFRSLQVARLRKNLPQNNAAVRANVESTVHAFKAPLARSKLRTRGLFRAQCFAYASALMVNLRRVHAYLQKVTPAMSATDASEALQELVLAMYGALVMAWTLVRSGLRLQNKTKLVFAS
jgi:hypothetical protein